MPLTVVQRRRIEFHLARAIAIEQYAAFESTMCECFSILGEISAHVAGTIFFRINNARVRRQLIEEFRKKKFGTRYSLFFRSLLRMMEAVDHKRNELVHWCSLTEVTDEGEFPKLAPGNFWTKADAPQYSTDDFLSFIDKCSFANRAMSMWYMSIKHPNYLQEVARGQEVAQMFEEELIYPPPSGHVLSDTIARRLISDYLPE